ncbi:MAG: hypothetical protein NVSMB55_25730 [Mycobacteriales bacterium]
MYARITTIDGNASRIDEAIRFVQGTVQPLLEQLPGSLGLAMFVNRDKGRVAVSTAWTTAAARAASDAPLTPIRGEAARILGGQARLEEFELAVVERLRPASPGCWNRATRLSVPVNRLAAASASFREDVLPGLRGQRGFCGGVLLVDRATGTAIGSTTWDSRDALEASRATAAQLRTRTADSSGATVIEVVESEIVIAGLVLPTRHEDLFRRVYAAMSAGGNLADLDAVIAADLVEHAALPPGVPPGLAGLKEMVATYRRAFPDFTIVIEKYVEQDDVGCAVIRVTGTHTGPFMGAPASGRTVDVTGIDVVRFDAGRAVEHWGSQDNLGLFTQIGLFAIPEQVALTIELPRESRV